MSQPSPEEIGRKIMDNIGQVLIGKAEAAELCLVALGCGGHLLIEDVPGVGKTMLARSLACSLGLSFSRIQCTPDLLPSDITGVSVFNPQEGTFLFRSGPVMANIVLVDEVNRATPRTQSGLLEVMEERQVTVDGKTYNLPDPFMVIATNNPIEFEGTFPLPAQLDWFLPALTWVIPARPRARSWADWKRSIRSKNYKLSQRKRLPPLLTLAVQCLLRIVSALIL